MDFDEQAEALTIQQIFRDIELGNSESCIQLLEDNPSLINSKAPNDWTPAMFAA